MLCPSNLLIFVPPSRISVTHFSTPEVFLDDPETNGERGERERGKGVFYCLIVLLILAIRHHGFVVQLHDMHDCDMTLVRERT